MGNCMEACNSKEEQQQEEKIEDVVQEQKPGEDLLKVGGDGFGKVGFRVKLVLPKEELEWLMSQLDVGGKKLEELLGEIEAGKGRGKVVVVAEEEDEEDDHPKVWKPSLESIMEIPEVHGEMER